VTDALGIHRIPVPEAGGGRIYFEAV